MRDKVRERSRTTEVMLAGAVVRAVDGDTLVLSHESAPLAKRLNEQRNTDVIQEALKDALGVNWKVRCEVGSAAPRQRRSRPPMPAAAPAADETKRTACWPRPAATTRRARRDPEEAALELLQNELGRAASTAARPSPPRPQRQPAVAAAGRRA